MTTPRRPVDHLAPGTLVRYAKPVQGEHHLRFRVIEDQGARILLEPLDPATAKLRPQEFVTREEVALAGTIPTCIYCRQMFSAVQWRCTNPKCITSKVTLVHVTTLDPRKG